MIYDGTYEPEYSLGSMYHGPCGDIWYYIKVVFCEDPVDAHVYVWMPWNAMAGSLDCSGLRPCYVTPKKPTPPLTLIQGL